MKTKSDLSRRRFLALTFWGTGGLYLLSQCSPANTSQFRFFTNDEANLLDALVEQIIPGDEWPGAKEAGATNFIDKQLLGPYSRFQETYRKGLKALQETSIQRYQKKFEALEFVLQTQFLELLEDGKMEGEAWKDGFGQHFFNLLRDHTLQSFYGSPRHGGNKGHVSYKMLRLDYPLIIGQNRYEV
jgi:gluconate 2-dehydrogenase gamma chain